MVAGIGFRVSAFAPQSVVGCFAYSSVMNTGCIQATTYGSHARFWPGPFGLVPFVRVLRDSMGSFEVNHSDASIAITVRTVGRSLLGIW
jgi:hypothetical protein